MTNWLTNRLGNTIERIFNKQICAISDALDIKIETHKAIIETHHSELLADLADKIEKAEARTKIKIGKDIKKLLPTLFEGSLGELRKMTADNLQLFQTQLQVMNAYYANFKGLLGIIERSLYPEGGDLEAEVEKAGYIYQVKMAYCDLDERVKPETHPAVREHLQAKLGKLYEIARKNGWVDLYNKAVQEYARDYLEKTH